MNKRYQALLSALTITSMTAFSQGVWEQQASFTGQARWGQSSFVIGNMGYMVGGLTTGGIDLAETHAYDPVSDTWTQKAAIPGGVRRMASSFVINDKGYVTCGLYSSSTKRNDLWEYDPIADAWTQRASLPSDPRFAAAGFSLNGKGYIVAGNMGNAFGPYSPQLWEYDPETNIWQERAPLPAVVRYAPEAFVANGRAYVLGGLKEDQFFSNELWMYDPTTNQWTEVASIPAAPRGLSFTWDLGERGLICGGNSDNGPVYDCWMYHAQEDEWTAVDDYPGDGARAGVSFLINDRIFAGLGLSGTSVAHDDLWELTGLTTSIAAAAAPQEFKLFPNPAVSGGHLVITGNTPLPANAEFRLYNGLGQMVQSTTLSASFGNIPVTLAELAPGAYTAAIVADGAVTHTTRLVVN